MILGRSGRGRPARLGAGPTLASGALLLILATLLVACSTSASPAAQAVTPGPATGVRGIVLFVGGPFIASTSPLPAGFGTTALGRPYPYVTVRVTALDGPRAGAVVALLKPDRQALFTVALPAGRYALDPLVPKDGPLPRQTKVVVRSGTYARAVVRVEGP